LRQISNEVAEFSRDGSRLFYQRNPRFTLDENAGLGDEDFLECSLLQDPDMWVCGPAFWRVSADGKAAIVEPYLEDQAERCSQVDKAIGSWINPWFLIQSLAEFVRHAQAMAERFNTSTRVSFRCEWSGILGRRLFVPGGRVGSDEAREDRRSSAADFPLTTIVGDWPYVVSQLAAPVLRAFTTSTLVTPESIRLQSSSWRR
jgi:hypothetical protein